MKKLFLIMLLALLPGLCFAGIQFPKKAGVVGGATTVDSLTTAGTVSAGETSSVTTRAKGSGTNPGELAIENTIGGIIFIAAPAGLTQTKIYTITESGSLGVMTEGVQ